MKKSEKQKLQALAKQMRQEARREFFEKQCATNPYKIKIVRQYGFKFYGAEIPKGAIYGRDALGPFYCIDFRVKGKKGYYYDRPRLVIFRPEDRKNWIKWNSAIEANDTTDAILSMYFEHECECTIDYSDQAHKVAKQIKMRPNFYEDEVHYTGAQIFRAKGAPATSLEYTVRQRTLEEIADEQRGKYIW